MSLRDHSVQDKVSRKLTSGSFRWFGLAAIYTAYVTVKVLHGNPKTLKIATVARNIAFNREKP